MRGRARLRAGTLLAAALVVLAPPAASASEGPAGTHGAPSLGTLVLPAIGPGYVVLSQGPVDPSTFASSAPDPSAVSSALANLSGSVTSYQRTWTDTAHLNAVQDMLFGFPSPSSAQIFLRSAQTSLQSGKIVTSGPLPGVPGAHRVTYFGATDEAGVGEAITQRVGDDVDLLSFFSSSSGNIHPITQADATVVVLAQDRALHAATAAGATVPGTKPPSTGTHGRLVLGVVVVLVLGLLLAALVLLRRRHTRSELPGSPAAT
jgi:hypothetical protein